ncbi:LLM class flavin-dependent oxidoreductase [Thermoflavimicrobium dichotomicum]|uniref:Luciferase family oxidoreductase, group 1 n=1 Tax=Thermoflavimicrobium dichotomicum TaxID=46223 RepID=A0A1I3U5B4_9BACL|nr:LLM class flavin-dependent oxidoreductase [Thermoflavimicrobium dichotomicum]SFJ76977.1 luciferase family oxidoreductase, group 1 [Thermoflavimicrobium dichotomicum]
MGIKLSILDQSPIFEGETATKAFQHTVELAQKAEELGYHRFWVSEHHDSDQLAGSSPEVLIAYLLAKTRRIRIGSGGVMLQHYSPYKVAENFNVLASLAPGRVDLGIGRAPGGLPRSTKALQQRAVHGSQSLSDKIIELEQFIQDRLDENHPLAGLRATPIPQQPAEIYLLGTSVSSAELAAKLGLPYVFAQFINSDESVADESFVTYRNHFNTDKGAQPQAILALSVIVADTDQEAKELAGEQKLVKIHLESGNTLTVGSVEHAEEYGRQSEENYTIEIKKANIICGSKETVRQKLLEAQKRYGVEEFIVTSAIQDFSKRIRSIELLKEAFTEVHTKR